jgi:hypothetical protein
MLLKTISPYLHHVYVDYHKSMPHNPLHLVSYHPHNPKNKVVILLDDKYDILYYDIYIIKWNFPQVKLDKDLFFISQSQ